MRRRMECVSLGLALFVGVLQTDFASAQLRGDKNFSVVNYLGRFHGIGYSDGYHACPDGNCGPKGSRQSGGGSYALYDTPSTVAPHTPLLVQDRFLGLRQNSVASEIPASPLFSPQASAYQSYPPTVYSTPSYPAPSYPVPGAVPYPTPSPIPSPEQVRPVPAGPLSPSDSNPRMRQQPAPLPAPAADPANSTYWVPSSPYEPDAIQSTQSNSIPPGMHSLLQQHFAPPPRY